MQQPRSASMPGLKELADNTGQTAEERLLESEERFRLISESAPVMIWVSDATGACQHLNRMLRDFWNVDEKRIDTFDWRDMMHPDDAPEIVRQIVDALARRTEVTVKGRYRDAGGQVRVLETHARPRFSAKGEFLGMIGVNVDVTERELAEKALRKSEERFRLAVEAAPSAMVMSDRNGRIVLINAQAEKLFGYRRDELIGEPIELLVPERYRRMHPRYRDDYGAGPSARPMGVGRDLFCLRKDGSEIPVEIGLSPIETLDGVMALAAIVDISERKRADRERELLLAELNHRVKNTLAVVQGIAHQTFKGDNASKEARSGFEGRLVALGVAHNLLTQANWENASMDQLAQDALQATGGNKSRISLSGPRVLLPPKAALSITMALHELATNAMKYGALSNDSGRIFLEWRREDGPPPQLKLRWREENGPPVAPPRRRGFGSLLLDRTLAQDLDASVRTLFNPEGLVCEIDAPLPEGSPAWH
jgi:PAS domain S-box-containing protein